VTNERVGPVARLDAPVELDASASFEAFFEAESQTLYRRLWLVTGNRSEAEEILQDAFLALWGRWDRVALLDDPTAYLYRTAMNTFRKRYRRAALAARRVVRPAFREDEFERADTAAVVRSTLGSLTPRQRAALVLTELLAFSADEAASILGVRAGTVRSHASQGRAAFRKILEASDA
jgi:RNA polymerase sigma factor (sigma-70 family)